tara:strand:+ start:12784 stop:13185 length:402 start_codon:yes stop_codon:yes gene_type:complete
MQTRPVFATAAIALLLCFCLLLDSAVTEAADTAERRLFAVEVKVGPNWDAAIAPHEQAFFSEHSAHLKELRKAGYIVMGARYSDLGLLIFSAETEESVAALMDKDPSMNAGTFVYAVHALNVFYPGQVGALAD